MASAMCLRASAHRRCLVRTVVGSPGVSSPPAFRPWRRLGRTICSAEYNSTSMAVGAIDTEDAARRLARVILSDIDLYIRERPTAGESREAQIEQGRRLFASRVTPELVPVFAMVLADRALHSG